MIWEIILKNLAIFTLKAFLENPSTPGKYTVILPPVVSTNIFDAKAKKKLTEKTSK